MADKRMFSQQIVDSDAFLDMPLSTQALYFHLSMHADDDGFLNNAKKIQKMIGAAEDDLKLLISKRFLIAFDDGILVVKHWRVNNYIRNDRYKPTVYQEEMRMLSVKNNGSYTINTLGIPNDNQVDTQYSIDKNSIDNICSNSLNEMEQKSCKKLKNEEIDKNFKIIYDSYPKKVGKARGFDLYKGWLKGRDISGRKVKLTNKQMWSAISRYKHQLKENETEKQFIKNFDTFMNKAILDYVEEEDVEHS